MDKLKILVSGGGLAGLTAAYWLRKHGHEPVVIEPVYGAMATAWTSSAPVTTWPSGWESLNLWRKRKFL